LKGGTEIVDILFLNYMTMRRRSSIIITHESISILRMDYFRDLIIQLGETKVKIFNGFTILIGNIVVFP
jgi:hypothetical protein